MTDTEFQRNATVVLFDGPCTLCNKSVDWIHSRDFYDTFTFASLTSEWAKAHLPEHLKHEDSVVLYVNGQFYIRSKAALLILERLPGYRWTRIFNLVPTFLRDFIQNHRQNTVSIIWSRLLHLRLRRENAQVIPKNLT